jgi:hypothetical protein
MGGTQSIKKSFVAPSSATASNRAKSNYQNQLMNNQTSANLAAGLSIANASLPFGVTQFLGGARSSGGNRGGGVGVAGGNNPINLNINFNTTNINMK